MEESGEGRAHGGQSYADHELVGGGRWKQVEEEARSKGKKRPGKQRGRKKRMKKV